MKNIACAHCMLVPKATNTHSGYVILIAFLLQQWLHERVQCYVMRKLPVLLGLLICDVPCRTVAYRGGFGGFKPPSEFPKALQNRARLNPIVKTVKNC
jgi:hypothetical protein